MRYLRSIVAALAVMSAPAAAQSAPTVGADVRIVTVGGRVIRGRLTAQDSATFSVWPEGGLSTRAAVVTARDSVALLELHTPGRFRAVYLVFGAAAGAAGGGMLGATVAWMECPFGENFVCSDRGRRDQRRAITTGAEIGVVAGVLAGFVYRPGYWRAVPAHRTHAAVVGLNQGFGLGMRVSL